MPRRREVPKREILPDPKFKDQRLAKFINTIMRHGKKSIAERLVYGALDDIARNLGSVAKKEGDSEGESGSGASSLDVFNRALDNVSPLVEVRSRRVGGATYQIPVEVSPLRQLALAMRWIVDAAKSRGEKTMSERLAKELLDAASRRGNAYKKREDTHRMAKANQAFAHFRW